MDLPLDQLKNICKATELWLNEVGIYTTGQLELIGPTAAFQRIRERRPYVSPLLLYVLQGALLHLEWLALPPDVRARLLLEQRAIPNGR